jgi:hypothetical protein
MKNILLPLAGIMLFALCSCSPSSAAISPLLDAGSDTPIAQPISSPTEDIPAEAGDALVTGIQPPDSPSIDIATTESINLFSVMLAGGKTGQLVLDTTLASEPNFEPVSLQLFNSQKELIWNQEVDTSHPGNRAFFLLPSDDGNPIFLEYRPYGINGSYDYTYRVFSVSEFGEEIVQDENHLYISASPVNRHFSKSEVEDFINGLNSYLENSGLLVASDQTVIRHFGYYGDPLELVEQIQKGEKPRELRHNGKLKYIYSTEQSPAHYYEYLFLQENTEEYNSLVYAAKSENTLLSLEERINAFWRDITVGLHPEITEGQVPEDEK